MKGKVSTSVHRPLNPNCAPACEQVAMPDGASPSAPVMRPGASDFRVALSTRRRSSVSGMMGVRRNTPVRSSAPAGGACGRPAISPAQAQVRERHAGSAPPRVMQRPRGRKPAGMAGRSCVLPGLQVGHGDRCLAPGLLLARGFLRGFHGLARRQCGFLMLADLLFSAPISSLGRSGCRRRRCGGGRGMGRGRVCAADTSRAPAGRCRAAVPRQSLLRNRRCQYAKEEGKSGYNADALLNVHLLEHVFSVVLNLEK